MASTKDLWKHFNFSNEDAPKLVFQCCRPDAEDEEGDSSSASRLLKIFEDSLKKKRVDPLMNELRLKTVMIDRYKSPSSPIPSVEVNFSDSKDSLTTEEVELLTFAEVLTDAGYELPDALQEKRKEILIHRRIPATPTSGPDGAINNFFAYTLTKTLVEICGKLSEEKVFKMKTSIIEKSEKKLAKSKTTRKILTKIEEAEQEMAKAITVIQSVESMQSSPWLKDAAFYYMVLFMFKRGLLDSVHTQKLEDCLVGDTAQPSQPEHISRALTQLKKYQLAKKPPGLCLILAMNIDRDGNKKDVAAVKSFFGSELKYDVIHIEDPSVSDVRTLIAKVGERRNKFYDSLVTWFMAHGDEAYLKVKDGEIHRRRDLIQPLASIGWLQAKPKLIFIQACAEKRTTSVYEDRGKQSGTDSLPTEPIDDDYKKMKKLCAANVDYSSVNNFADTLVCLSTMWYQPAARRENGSIFIHTILEVLKKKGREVSIDSVLREATLRMNSVLLRDDDDNFWRQTPYYESSLQKKFIFP